MTEEETLLRDQEALRGEQARELLENELLKEAFDLLEREYISAWIECPARDRDGKEELWKLVKNLRKVKGHLEAVLATGKMAKLQLASRKASNLWGHL